MTTLSTEMAAIAQLWQTAGIIPTAAPQERAAFDEEAFTREAVRRQRIEFFRTHCAPEFQKTIDRALIKNPSAWDLADKWDESSGLFIWSHESGRGKTRMAERLRWRAYVNRGKENRCLTGQELGERYFHAHMEGDPRAFYRWLLHYDFLVLDDIDKVNLSDPRSPRVLRELFDELYRTKKPVIVTSNEPIDYFAKTVGESCARRMREVCREIQF